MEFLDHTLTSIDLLIFLSGWIFGMSLSSILGKISRFSGSRIR